MKATFMRSITEHKKICPSAEGKAMPDWKARRYLFESDLYAKHNGAQKDTPSVEVEAMPDWKARRYLFGSDLYAKHNGAQKDMPERRGGRHA
ncbi:hypothetical protein MF069_03365 [Paenibacillus mucilaginosus]|uniref:hypothetical protein n=1 Tax=Paenibacillus mucilaginosus TaxID=61624 RepID=UPI001EF08BB9|nr:hypothetical protein [Paenibacillus mucilaginosus]MCG7211846.1 hypothetical protein [Paenibacillus mucilaginosus]